MVVAAVSPQGQQSADNRAEAIVLQFNPETFGEPLLALKEMATLQTLFRDARKGLLFDHEALTDSLIDAVCALPDTQGATRLIRALDILDQLSGTSRRTLSRHRPSYKRLEKQQERIDTVCTLIHSRLQDELTQTEVADAVHMSTASFSRFFKNAMGIRFQDYLNQLRIHHACLLLRTTDQSISEIAFSSGFGTLSNFNRRFKEHTKSTPREYRITSALTQSS